MVQTFNNQVMFGHREWSILTNNTTQPVGPDNTPLSDKPLFKEISKREPSPIDENIKKDPGIIGYMGADEDVEQAKYEVMSLLTDKLGGLDDRLQGINNDLSSLIGANERDITELRGEFISEECTPFLIDKCGEEETVQGCSECANYWREQNKLPENCGSSGVSNHCNFHNNYTMYQSQKKKQINKPLVSRTTLYFIFHLIFNTV